MAVTIKGFASDWTVPAGARTHLDELYARKNGATISARDYGAMGDGVADDTAPIQSAINAAGTFGVPVFLSAGRYRITSTVTLPSGVTLRGAGPGTVIDIKGLGSTTTAPKTAFQAAGTIETAQAVAADVGRGSKFVDLSAATTLVRGDFVLLSSDQTFHATASLKRGEIKRVESVSGMTVAFEDATYDSYAAASGAKLQRVVPVTGIRVEDLTVEGTDDDNQERGLFINYGDDIAVAGCTFNYTDWNSINLRNVTNFKVTGNTFRNVDWVSNSPNYYGLVVENASAHGVFSGNHGTKCRHLFTTGYTTTVPGVSRFIVVSNNVDTYSQSASFDTHDGSEFITITGNMSSFSETNGINVESRETIVSDNQILNYSSTLGGIYVRAGAENVTIRGNRLISTVSGTYGVYVRRTYTHRPRRINVSENIIDVATNGNAIYLLDADDCRVAGNSVGPCATGVFLNGANRCQVEGNTFTGPVTYPVRVQASSRVRVIGNSAGSGTAMLYMYDAVGTIIANNYGGTCNALIRSTESTAGALTNTLIMGNDCTALALSAFYYGALPGSYKIVGNLGLDDAVA